SLATPTRTRVLELFQNLLIMKEERDEPPLEPRGPHTGRGSRSVELRPTQQLVEGCSLPPWERPPEGLPLLDFASLGHPERGDGSTHRYGTSGAGRAARAPRADDWAYRG